jgi:hypothetical protein
MEAGGKVNIALSELIKSLPARVFEQDPAKLAAYYRLAPDLAALVVRLLHRDDYLDGLIARGDYILTASGFQCLEMNYGGNLGGWETSVWTQMYSQVPLFERFVREEAVAYHHRSPVDLFFSHAIERARKTGLLDGRLDFAFLVPPDSRSGSEVQAYAGQELQRALLRYAPGVAGKIVVCHASELTSTGSGLHYGGQRIQAVVEHSFERSHPRVIESLLAGEVNVYDGPLTQLLMDKRNLALLSERQESSLFSAAEREVITAQVPWTREVGPSQVSFQGREAALPDLLLQQRDRFVLKPANAAQGFGVRVGCLLSAVEWEICVEDALAAEEPWVVQERCESLPLLYQSGERDCGAHDVIWGLFAFGRSYGGGFLRMSPREGSRGVVNSAQGATEGVIMEVAR